MSTYLENYLESKLLPNSHPDPLTPRAGISTLPAELRRNFSLMRELDDRTKGKRLG